MNNFKISGFSDEISPDFIEQLEEIKKMDIAYIEIRGVNGKNISELTLTEVYEVKKQLNKYGVKISSIGSPIGKIKMKDDFDAHFKVFKHIVDIAEILEAPYIRMFSFFMEQDETATHRDEVIRRLKLMKDYVKGHSVILLHENEKEIYGDVAERCLDLYRELGDDQFKLIFDPANFIQCGVDVKFAYEMLKNYVAYFHIKDADLDGKVVPAGYGVGHLDLIIDDLVNKGYDGFLSIEPHLGSFEGLDSLEKNIVMKEQSDAAKFRLAKDSLMKVIQEVVND